MESIGNHNISTSKRQTSIAVGVREFAARENDRSLAPLACQDYTTRRQVVPCRRCRCRGQHFLAIRIERSCIGGPCIGECTREASRRSTIVRVDRYSAVPVCVAARGSCSTSRNATALYVGTTRRRRTVGAYPSGRDTSRDARGRAIRRNTLQLNWSHSLCLYGSLGGRIDAGNVGDGSSHVAHQGTSLGRSQRTPAGASIVTSCQATSSATRHVALDELYFQRG
jgi:hypothetical protein